MKEKNSTEGPGMVLTAVTKTLAQEILDQNRCVLQMNQHLLLQADSLRIGAIPKEDIAKLKEMMRDINETPQGVSVDELARALLSWDGDEAKNWFRISVADAHNLRRQAEYLFARFDITRKPQAENQETRG
jgi:hypothetical protein